MAQTDFTPNLGLSYLLSNQAQKHVTLNESLRTLDGLVHLSVLERGLSSPPGSSSDGQRYLIGDTAIGDWTGHNGEIAFFADGGWLFFEPQTGWSLWDQNEAKWLIYDGLEWKEVHPENLQDLTRLGLGGMADAANPLLVKLNSALMTAQDVGNGGNGDLYFKFNKETSTDFLSLLFQTGFATHAEMGLMGDNDFAIKVSPDGSIFFESLRVDKQDGKVSFPSGLTGVQLTQLDDTPTDFSGHSGKALIVNADEDAVSFVERRERLTAARTYFVDAQTGADTNDGLSSASPFLTLQRAVNKALDLNFGTYPVTIQLADGVYTSGAVFKGGWSGSGELTIRGNSADDGAVQIMTNMGSAVSVTGTLPARLHLRHLTLGSANNNAVANSGIGTITIGSIIFAATHRYHLTASGSGANILTQGSYKISGGASRHVNCQAGASVSIGGVGVIEFIANADFSVFILCFLGGLVTANGLTFDLGAFQVTGMRYSVQSNSVIFTSGGGATYFPGDVAGSAIQGGQYV